VEPWTPPRVRALDDDDLVDGRRGEALQYGG
jgi:hypothetical protein